MRDIKNKICTGIAAASSITIGNLFLTQTVNWLHCWRMIVEWSCSCATRSSALICLSRTCTRRFGALGQMLIMYVCLKIYYIMLDGSREDL